jgi:hypothetical protein
VAVAILLATIVGLIALATWRRGPRGQTSPDRAYGTVTGIASRLGYGPRPSQTVYEYAGALGDVLPTARPALETVARWWDDHGRGVSAGRLGLREAERRLRVSLLRLLFVEAYPASVSVGRFGAWPRGFNGRVGGLRPPQRDIRR